MLWAQFPRHHIAIPEVASQGSRGLQVHEKMPREVLLKFKVVAVETIK